MNLNKSIFISTADLPFSFQRKLEEKSFSINSRSLIRFEPVSFKISPSDFDWIFFTSKRSVDYFLNGCSISLQNHKIACIGKSTADYLTNKKIAVDFFGTNAGNPIEVGKEFSSCLKTERVLFPLSSLSKKSISNLIPASQKIERVVYKTVLNPVEITTTFDYLVFTSPSNAESFLLKNELNKSQTVIAWGNSTADFLAQRGILVAHTLKKSSFSELLHLLLGV